MPRHPTDSPEAQLVSDARKVGVLVFYSPAALAEGKPHIRLFARGGNRAELPDVESARVWLRLQREVAA